MYKITKKCIKYIDEKNYKMYNCDVENIQKKKENDTMRKVNKVLVSMSLILMLVFIYPVTVRAEEDTDYTGYEELADELSGTHSSTGTTTGTKSEATSASSESTSKTTKNSSSTTETASSTSSSSSTSNSSSTKSSNAATKSHAKAGGFDVVMFVTLSVVTVALTGIGYVKFRKYNY